MNQKSNKNFSVPSRSHKLTAKPLGFRHARLQSAFLPRRCPATPLPPGRGRSGVGRGLCGADHAAILPQSCAAGVSVPVLEPSQPSPDAFVIGAAQGSAFPLGEPQELELSLRSPRTLLPAAERADCGMGGVCSPPLLSPELRESGACLKNPCRNGVE